MFNSSSKDFPIAKFMKISSTASGLSHIETDRINLKICPPKKHNKLKIA